MKELMKYISYGLCSGSMYAIVALGYTLVYGIVRLINFAHGDFIMVGGYTLFFTIPIMTKLGFPAWSAVLFGTIVCGLVGILVERIAYRPIRKKGDNMTALITAIAMSLILENLAQMIPPIGPNPKVFDLSRAVFHVGDIQLGSITLNGKTVIAMGICFIVMIGLKFIVSKTRFGMAMRAISEDKEAAILVGMDVNKTIGMTFAVGASLAAFASLIYCAQYNKVYTTLGSTLGLVAFVAAVVGGIGSIPGALVGGFIIGIVRELTAGYISSGAAEAIVYAVLILVLIVKPTGIFGKNEKEKV